MKQLTNIQSILFIIGGVLMVVGAGCMAFGFIYPLLCQIVSWLFLLGAVLFSVMQMQQTYDGLNFTVKRLKKLQTVADLFFVLAGLSAVETTHQFMRGYFEMQAYSTYFGNKWVVFMLVAAMIELYTVHRIDHELKKEKV